MKNLMWKLLARILARPAVAQWLWRRAVKTPYSPIVKGGEIYMERYWLFNPYRFGDQPRTARNWLRDRLPSARIHVILLPDQDRHLHSHPWDARTIILKGGYLEERRIVRFDGGQTTINNFLYAGDTAPLAPTDYHRITCLQRDQPVTTLFITWKYAAKWGFLVDGKHIYWKDYLNEHEGN